MVNKKILSEFPNYYICDDGSVINIKSGRVLKANSQPRGYLSYRLCNSDGKFITKAAHRLVAQAFLPDYSKNLQVDHVDCNKHNNHIENLEMVSESENMKRAVKNNLVSLDKVRKHYTVTLINTSSAGDIHEFGTLADALTYLGIPTNSKRYYNHKNEENLCIKGYKILVN